MCAVAVYVAGSLVRKFFLFPSPSRDSYHMNRIPLISNILPSFGGYIRYSSIPISPAPKKTHTINCINTVDIRLCYEERSNLRCSIFLFLKINSPVVSFVFAKKNSTTVTMGDQVTVGNLEDNSLSWTGEKDSSSFYIKKFGIL